jgi:hypothetical protein
MVGASGGAGKPITLEARRLLLTSTASRAAARSPATAGEQVGSEKLLPPYICAIQAPKVTPDPKSTRSLYTSSVMDRRSCKRSGVAPRVLFSNVPDRSCGAVACLITHPQPAALGAGGTPYLCRQKWRAGTPERLGLSLRRDMPGGITCRQNDVARSATRSVPTAGEVWKAARMVASGK